MKGKNPNTTVGGWISRNYSFMNKKITADIQCMVHGRLFVLTGEMNFIHIIYFEFF